MATLGPTRRFEGLWKRRGFALVAGVDEVGRGCLAGPVVAAAVILDRHPPRGLNDSKLLSRRERERLFAALEASDAHCAWALADCREIDALNIRQASFLAMRRAITRLSVVPEALLVDGFAIPDCELPQRALVGGDRRSLSIAAASIVAKVSRDRLMADLAREYPAYGFERHVGYATREHLAALARWGVTPQHRLTFSPVREALGRCGERAPSQAWYEIG
ncbi:MAG: ribonuclease HII [Candidatus Eisenbacteria sp.]|nr:ribonuclease HII [Candidatus Eisenbacteria bacterium]